MKKIKQDVAGLTDLFFMLEEAKKAQGNDILIDNRMIGKSKTWRSGRIQFQADKTAI